MVKQSALDNWNRFATNRTGYKGIKWKIDNSLYKLQNDSYNCGVYVCYYMKKLISNEMNLQTHVNIDDFRNIIRQEIIRNSLKN